MRSTRATTFAELGIEVPGGVAGEIRALCPECSPGHRGSSKTLGLNVETGVYNCFRCGFKGRVGGRTIKGEFLSMVQAQNAAKARQWREAAKRAQVLWGRAEPALFHDYLKRKRVLPLGLRALSGRLLVPMHDVRGELWNVQVIDRRGRKRFLRGGRVTGLFFSIPQQPWCEDRALYVAEGFATAASVHLRFAKGAAVAVAFNAGNLKPVALALRDAYPRTELVLAADNDAYTENNPGLTKAREAAALVAGRVVWPTFDGYDTSLRPTDFNDLHCLRCAIEDNDG